MLCHAAGRDYLTLVDDRRIVGHTMSDWDWNDYYRALIHGNDSDGQRELLTSLGLGFYIEDQPIGTVPNESKYWLKGILVCLVPRLDESNVAPNTLTEAVHYGRDICGRLSFNVVLISIFDIVLFKYFPNGSVDHSAVMPLLHVRDCSGLDLKQRFSDIWLDSALERHRQNLREPNKYPERGLDIKFPLKLVPDKVVEAIFLRLVNFFDLTTIAALLPVSLSLCSVLPKVISIILGQVSDTKTFIAYTKVSRTFRDLYK